MAQRTATLRRHAVKDLYALLGVAPDATTDEIAAAFRVRAKELHPDRAPGDAVTADRFKELSDAYATLARRESRAAYDARRGTLASAAPAAGAPEPRTHQVLATRGRARGALIGGLACVLAGLAMSPVLLSIDTSPDTVGRDVTLWLVVAKLLIGGLVLAGAGWWRLAMLRAGPTPGRLPTRR